MRLLLAPSILFKASICSGKEQGSAGKAAFVRQCHLFLGLQTAKPELRGCTPVRAVPELHSASSTGQDSPAPGIWGIKESQEKKLLFFSLISVPLVGARRLQHTWVLMNSCRYASKRTGLGQQSPTALLLTDLLS